MHERSVLLEVRGISKTFPGLRALSAVDLAVHEGEVVALVGQNGSGKSTLVKILAGVQEADAGGSVRVAAADGELRELRDADDRLRFIHQDLGLIPALTTIENLSLGRSVGREALLPPHRAGEQQRAEASIARFDAHFDVTLPVSRLSAAEKTIVAITRAMSGWNDPRRVLVLDEPTATLHDAEVDQLYRAIRAVTRLGAGVIFISHRLGEVIELADTVVALRDGVLTHRAERGSIDHESLVRAISGKTISLSVERSQAERGDVVLDVEGIVGGRVRGVTVSVHAGEVVGLTGLLDSGRDELLGVVFGHRERRAGTVVVGGVAVPPGSPRRSIGARLAYIPADRRGAAAIVDMSASENLTLPRLSPLRSRWGTIRSKAMRAEAHEWIDRLAVRPAEPDKAFGLFSGGNQQKLVLAKWLRTAPLAYLIDEPTQGVDVEAKATIHRQLRAAADNGAAVMVSSSDTAELAGLCDRVIVLDRGRIVDELQGNGLTEESLVFAAQGIAPLSTPLTKVTP